MEGISTEIQKVETAKEHLRAAVGKLDGLAAVMPFGYYPSESNRLFGLMLLLALMGLVVWLVMRHNRNAPNQPQPPANQIQLPPLAVNVAPLPPLQFQLQPVPPAPAPATPPVPAPAAGNCRHCGGHYARGVVFCPACGGRVMP
jgi:predicted lipid-binding transport protein (Tim44 family)